MASLDVAPLKPNASSMEASAGWDPQLDGEGIIYSAHKDLEAERVTSLARLLAQSALQQVSSSNGHLSGSKSHLMENTVPSARVLKKCIVGDVGMSKSGDGKIDSVGQTDNNDRGKNVSPDSGEEGKANVKSYSRRKRKSGETTNGSQRGTSSGVANAENSDETVGRRHKGDEEFETQVAVALCATAAAAKQQSLSNSEPPISNSPLAVKRLNGTLGLKRKVEGRLKKKLGMS